MKRLLGAAALVCFGAFSLFASSAGVMPVPEQQFFDANGLPLSGGYIYTCVAGTSCPGNPLATYTDASGTTANPNPVVLDSGGRASIWLGGSSYKIVAEDASGNVVWTADNVSIPGLSLLSGTGSLSALTVTGNVTIGGTLGVTGDATFSSDVTVSGTLTAGTLAVTGNATVGGTLGVTGATTLHNTTVSGTLNVSGATTLAGLNAGATTVSSLNVGAQTLAQVIDTAIASGGAPSSLNGSDVISSISAQAVTNGTWEIFTFGTVAGTRVEIAIGSGTAGNGATIPMPTGFNTINLIATANLGAVNTGASGNNITTFDIGVSGGTITATAGDFSGHSYTVTANWFAIAWLTGQ